MELMGKMEILDSLLQKGNGFLKTSAVVHAGISRTYLGAYVRERGLERVAQGLYMSPDAWEDGMYVIQTRYPEAVFSHETALYLLNLADREPVRYTVTLKTGTNATGLTKQGVKVYKVKTELFFEGIEETQSPAGHTVRVYIPERTICDLFRSRTNVEIQDLQTAIREYARFKEKNIPLLMRYAKAFSIERIIRPYLEALL
jgi:predicted transcriptional regulator of viral defense system